MFPHLSVLENVRVALQRRQGTSFQFWRSESTLETLHDRARELIDAVNLTAYLDHAAAGHQCRAKLVRRRRRDVHHTAHPLGRHAARGAAATCHHEAGSFRQRAFRITTTCRATLYAMDADINAGAS